MDPQPEPVSYICGGKFISLSLFPSESYLGKYCSVYVALERRKKLRPFIVHVFFRLRAREHFEARRCDSVQRVWVSHSLQEKDPSK